MKVYLGLIGSYRTFYDKLKPNNYELKEMSKKIKCNNILMKYNLPLQKDVEEKYKSDWWFNYNVNVYSFNINVGPLWYDDFF